MIHFFFQMSIFSLHLLLEHILSGDSLRNLKILKLANFHLSESLVYFFVFGVESGILIFEWRLEKRRQEKSISEIVRQFNLQLSIGSR